MEMIITTTTIAVELASMYSTMNSDLMEDGLITEATEEFGSLIQVEIFILMQQTDTG